PPREVALRDRDAHEEEPLPEGGGLGRRVLTGERVVQAEETERRDQEHERPETDEHEAELRHRHPPLAPRARAGIARGGAPRGSSPRSPRGRARSRRRGRAAIPPPPPRPR